MPKRRKREPDRETEYIVTVTSREGVLDQVIETTPTRAKKAGARLLKRHTPRVSIRKG